VTFHDGETAVAKVVGTDPGADVAVIKVENTSYRPLPKGQSKSLKVGEWVMAVGSPFGLSQSVTAGIVSATERSVAETTGMRITDYEAFIQTDATINPGNSGGPLINMEGRVVGVNSAIATPNRAWAGVGFAIPIDLASHLADKLIKDGKISRVRVGIRMEPMTPKLARSMKLDPKTHGVAVAEVVEGSPAAKAGVQKGDVIVGFDGHPVTGPSAFRILVSTGDTDKAYELKYLRDGKEQSTSITPAPEEKVRFAFERGEDRRPRAEAARPATSSGFGLGVQDLTPELAEQFGYPKGTEGVVVASVEEDSPAARAGLEEGDLITKVVKDKKIEAVKSAKDFGSLIGKDAEELAVYVKDVRNPKKEGTFLTLSKKVKAEKE